MANDFQVLGLDLITSIYPDQSNFKSDFWSEKKKKKKKYVLLWLLTLIIHLGCNLHIWKAYTLGIGPGVQVFTGALNKSLCMKWCYKHVSLIETKWVCSTLSLHVFLPLLSISPSFLSTQSIFIFRSAHSLWWLKPDAITLACCSLGSPHSPTLLFTSNP